MSKKFQLGSVCVCVCIFCAIVSASLQFPILNRAHFRMNLEILQVFQYLNSFLLQFNKTIIYANNEIKSLSTPLAV